MLNRIIGGWQLAGSGSLTSTWWPLPTGNWVFKVIPVKEQVAFRLNIGFFNVFNIPGIPKTPSSGSGIIDAQHSGNGARALQFGLRLNW